MAYPTPFSKKELKKKGIINEKELFRMISEKMNFADDAVVKAFYNALVKSVTTQIRTRGFSRLPFLGDFALVWQKEKTGYVGRDSMTGKPQRTMLPPKRVLKFYPNDNWRQYFSKMDATKSQDGTEVL